MEDSPEPSAPTSRASSGATADQPSANAVLASDYDGDLFLVALDDDVDDWVVEVRRPDGSMAIADQTSFVGGWYQSLHGRPAWDVVSYQTPWRLSVGGSPVDRLWPGTIGGPAGRSAAAPSWP